MHLYIATFGDSGDIESIRAGVHIYCYQYTRIQDKVLAAC